MNESSSIDISMESVGSILSRLMASAPMAGLTAYAPIWNDWPFLLGDKLAGHMSPRSVSNGRLHVMVENDAMRHRLELQKHSILSKINQRLNPEKVTDIVFELSDKA